VNYPEKILVADDEIQKLEHLVTILQDEDYFVEGVSNGEQVLEHLREREYNLLITDLQLPKQNGLELLSTVRDQYPETGVILLVDDPSLDSVIQSLRWGAFDYVVRPFKMDYLKTRVTDYLEKIEKQGRIDFGKVAKTYELSKRETDVVEQLYEGLANAEIAKNLQIARECLKLKSPILN